MDEVLGARNFIVDFLRRELVGPSPVHPYVQSDGEEVLRLQDSPRQRYGAGVLFPLRAEVTTQDETAADESPEIGAESPDDDGEIDTHNPSESSTSQAGLGDVAPETDYDVTLANQFLPSAMGISALVEVPETLRVTVTAGSYVQADFQPSVDGEEPRSAWLRRPLNRTLDISASELVGPGNVRLERPVDTDDGHTTLALHILSRPDRSATNSRQNRLITFTLINRRQSSTGAQHNSDCFFQCRFEVESSDGEPCFLSYPEYGQRDVAGDDEELSLRLLHLHRRTFAVGHGCAADWDEPGGDRTATIRTEVLPTYEVKPVLPKQIEGLELSMIVLGSEDTQVAVDLCSRLADSYADWITDKEAEVEARADLSPVLKDTARRHLSSCRECLRRMRDGIQLLSEDTNVANAFRLMNEAMLMQQIHYEVSTQKVRTWKQQLGKLVLESPFQPPSYDDPSRTWRPFQLAFILMNLRSLAESDCPEREVVDVIWFPTGGGKTEAYLGLSAFSLFIRRLRNPDNGGTSILMRYTLRLLTTQQFQRAASLICACEVIRRREAQVLGAERFSIGLWVGGQVTPNNENGAVNTLNDLLAGRGANLFVLLACPWCGSAMGPQSVGQRIQCKGYRKSARPARVRHICEDSDCEFSSAEGLPVAVIDEQIYKSPPSLLIGTVDKFALLAFRPEARRLFGIDTPYDPPDLVIQDELHLITGPLGSMVGHYETVIDALCRGLGGGKGRPAKLVGSTATISRAESQVRGLYGRSTFLFPPQALRAGDSFFAEEREDQIGRLYTGVFATALTSHVTSQIRVMGALLQAPGLYQAATPDVIDPYWTMIGYFNSLRELGHAATLIRADIREYLNAMWDRLGLRLNVARNLQADPRRFINRDVELTSRVQSSDIPNILQQLFATYDGSRESGVIDVCFATNMIQVGIDIPRLSLMTIVGQPKTTSEYIQASSRIGRTVPGIVVTILNPFKSRDRSHYEHFRTYHQSLYMHVEPSSVTPFSVRVRERALHALLVILCRFWGDTSILESPTPPPSDELMEMVKDAIRDRVMVVDPDEWPRTEVQVDDIFRRWKIAPRSLYGDFRRPSPQLPMMKPAGRPPHPEWPEPPYDTPSSMRSVDADCGALYLTGGYDFGVAEND